MPTKTRSKTTNAVTPAPAPTHPISEAAVVLATGPAVREELETQADATRRSAATLAADLAAIEAAYNEQADGLATFRDQLAATETALEKTQATLRLVIGSAAEETTRARIAGLEAERDQLTADLADAEREAEARRARVDDQLAELRSRLDGERDTLGRLEDEIARLDDQLREARAQRGREVHAEVMDAIAECDHRLADLREQTADARQALYEAKFAARDRLAVWPEFAEEIARLLPPVPTVTPAERLLDAHLALLDALAAASGHVRVDAIPGSPHTPTLPALLALSEEAVRFLLTGRRSGGFANQARPDDESAVARELHARRRTSEQARDEWRRHHLAGGRLF